MAEQFVVCKVCQTAYSKEKTRCPMCDYQPPLEFGTVKLGENLTRTQNNVSVNVGETSFNSNMKLGLHFLHSNKHLDCEFRKYLVLGRTVCEDEDYVDLTAYQGVEFGISRRHVRIVKHIGSVTCQDLGSQNGTFLNGGRLVANKLTLMRDGDELRLGKMLIQVSFISE